MSDLSDITPERWQQVKAILAEALELPVAQRKAFVSASCDGDTRLEAQVERLLDLSSGSGISDLLAPIDNEEQPVPPTLAAGDMVGRYRISRLIGRGGMGEVYLASDTDLRRDVALKTLHPRLASDARFKRHLTREAIAVARVGHPNVAAVYDVVERQGRIHIVMELLAGETLAKRLARGPLAAEELLRVAVQLSAALEHAHGQGILHCDIKPANVFVTRDGTWKVLDFGVARRLATPSDAAADRTSAPAVVMASRDTSAVVHAGTPRYMSPEQLAGRPVDQRSDLYGLALVLLEAARPTAFDDGTQLPGAWHPLLRGVEPAWCREALTRALQDDPADRFQTVAAFREALLLAAPAPLVERVTGRRRRWSRAILLGAGALTGIVGLCMAAFRSAPTGTEPLVPEQLTRRIAGAPITNALVSWDGQVVAYADKEGLWLQRLDGSPALLVPDTKGYLLLEAPYAGGFSVMLSPDGEQVENPFRILHGDGRLVPAPRARFEIVGSRVYPSPTSPSVLFRHQYRRLGTLERDGQVVATDDHMALFPVRWSPEGTFVVYQDDRNDGSIWKSMDARTGAVHVLTKQGRAFDWPQVLPGGLLWFTARAGRGAELMELRVNPQTGALVADPSKIAAWPDLPADGLSASRDGRVLTFRSSRTDVTPTVGELRPDGTLHATQPLDLDGQSWPVGWSGQVPLYSSPSGLCAAEALGKCRLILGKSARFDLWAVFPGGATLLGSLTKDKTRTLVTVPVAGGQPKDLMPLPPVGDPAVDSFAPFFEPSAACGLRRGCVYLEPSPDRGSTTVRELDPVRGKGKLLHRVASGRVGRAALSPDGDRLAYFSTASPAPQEYAVDVVELRNGNTRTVRFARRSAQGTMSLHWSADGESLWIGLIGAGAPSEGEVINLRLTGERRVIYAGANTALPSPDGTKLLMTVWSTRSDVWLLRRSAVRP